MLQTTQLLQVMQQTENRFPSIFVRVICKHKPAKCLHALLPTKTVLHQVGIIALNLVGQVIQTENMQGAPSYVSNHYQPSHISAAAGAMADLSLDVNVDPVTAAKIREISKRKEAAVAKEDYDDAKRLKLAIERLKAVGQKVAQLEARKRQAGKSCQELECSSRSSVTNLCSN